MGAGQDSEGCCDIWVRGGRCRGRWGSGSRVQLVVDRLAGGVGLLTGQLPYRLETEERPRKRPVEAWLFQAPRVRSPSVVGNHRQSQPVDDRFTLGSRSFLDCYRQ